jgi:hypothetical protein
MTFSYIISGEDSQDIPGVSLLGNACNGHLAAPDTSKTPDPGVTPRRRGTW